MKEGGIDSVVDEAQESSEQEASSVEDSIAGPRGSGQNTTSIQGGGSTPSSESNYNPNRCKGLENEYQKLKTISGNNYTTFNDAMNSAKIWGDIYEEMGRNKAFTDQAYNEQQAYIEVLQEAWKDSLDDQNDAYSAFQKCQASNY